MKLKMSTLRRNAVLGGMLGIALFAAQGQAALAQQQHSLPLVKPADSAQQGFVRIINRSDSAGTVTIHAIDDAGDRYGPITLELAAEYTQHLNSQDLEEGNTDKGLSGALGDGEGDWRLELTTNLDIEALAYIRTPAGFLTSMHDVVLAENVGTPGVDDYMQHRVWFFNPGSNRNQQSLLRVINVTGIDNEVTITALDDDGQSGGEVQFTLGPYEARAITAEDLEQGADDLEGSLGDGARKWQLIVTTEFASPEERRVSRPIQVMSLMHSTGTGNLTNLSATGAGNDSSRGTPGVDWIWGSDGDDILNPGDSDVYDSTYGSAGNDTIVYSDSGPGAYQWLGYFGLATAIAATINGVSNVGTVDKGSNGFDTIVDIANPLNAGAEPPYRGFGLGGSPNDDRFDLTLDDGQWMDVRGEAGDDTITIRSGRVRATYRHTLNSVDVDLAAGRANDDGHGDVDTFVGTVHEVQGGLGDDTIRGSDGSDRLGGGPGNDMLNPRNNNYRNGDDKVFGSFGDDTIDYGDTREGASHHIYYRDPTFSEGIEATINGMSNSATVDKGAAGTDTIIDIRTPVSLQDGGFSITGTSFDDVFNLTLGDGQTMQVRGQAGNDTFNLTSSSPTGRISYSLSPAGIDIDLAAGRANNDGYGDVDTITGPFRDVRGSDFSDVIRGSDNDESFSGRAGDDTIDGGGGYDRLRYDTSEVEFVHVDTGARTVTGVWRGSTFTHRFSNIERIRGSNRDDTFRSGAGNDSFEGRSGRDTFVFGLNHGEDEIRDFTLGEDRIDLNVFGLSNDALIGDSSRTGSGGTWIDLTRYGGGTINVRNVDPDDLGDSDFLL